MKISFEHECRQWGSFDVLAKGRDVLVKVMKISPGEAISLQRHAMRDQLYFCITPILIQFGTRKEDLTTVEVSRYGKVFYFPAGMWHRARGYSDQTAIYVEISFGKYDESDIERCDDLYDRHLPERKC